MHEGISGEKKAPPTPAKQKSNNHHGPLDIIRPTVGPRLQNYFCHATKRLQSNRCWTRKLWFHIFMFIIEILFCCWYNTLNIQYTISGSNFFLGKWCWASFNTLLSSQLHQFGWVAGRTRLFMWCVIADRTEKGMSGCVCYM